MQEALKKYFGFNSFRDPQETIIRKLIEDKKDTLAIMPTGKGKSLCYQFPAVYLKKTALIVSPLISLQDDQVMGLVEKGISATVLNSNLRGAKRDKIMKDVMANEYRLVFITPEFVSGYSDYLENLYDQGHICLIGIDEAHSISTWGHSFRSEYRNLHTLRSIMPGVPMLAVTATATDNVRKDIITQLCLKNPFEITTSFDRPNIFIAVREKSDPEKDILPLLDLNASNIIYTITRDDAEKLNDTLRANKINSQVYHAGMTDKKRKEVHHAFIFDECKVIIGTIAFGMGIDKPNIRNVIVYGCPSDIETMYQEIGRAGRDGLPSNAYIFFTKKDFIIHKFLIEKIKENQYQSTKVGLLKKIGDFLKISGCRRNYVLNYFGKNENVDNPHCCDNCEAMKTKVKILGRDYTKEKDLVIKAVVKLSVGANKICDTLVGSNAQTIQPWMKKLDFYGAGNEHNKSWWMGFLGLLEENGKVLYHKPEGFNGFILKAGENTDGTFIAVANQQMVREEQDLKVNKVTVVDEDELYKLIIKIRDELSVKHAVPPVAILPDTAVIGLWKNKPENEKEFLKINGVNKLISSKYGPKFIEAIKTWKAFNTMTSV
jgi:RecQ family ATP-dependent DNA helicase